MQKMLEGYLKEFDNDEQSVIYFEAVKKTFHDYPKNVKKLDVVLKVAVINELYRTNVLGAYKMVSHIQKLATKEDLDNLLKKGDINAINKIRKGHGNLCKNSKENRDDYSFATKYCHFSNPKCYPIYDHYVEMAIKDLQKNNKSQEQKQEDIYDQQKDNLRDPLVFKSIIDRIRVRSGINDYQKIDRALWVYGNVLAKEW